MRMGASTSTFWCLRWCGWAAAAPVDGWVYHLRGFARMLCHQNMGIEGLYVYIYICIGWTIIDDWWYTVDWWLYGLYYAVLRNTWYGHHIYHIYIYHHIAIWENNDCKHCSPEYEFLKNSGDQWTTLVIWRDMIFWGQSRKKWWQSQCIQAHPRIESHGWEVHLISG